MVPFGPAKNHGKNPRTGGRPVQHHGWPAQLLSVCGRREDQRESLGRCCGHRGAAQGTLAGDWWWRRRLLDPSLKMMRNWQKGKIKIHDFSSFSPFKLLVFGYHWISPFQSHPYGHGRWDTWPGWERDFQRTNQEEAEGSACPIQLNGRQCLLIFMFCYTTALNLYGSVWN